MINSVQGNQNNTEQNLFLVWIFILYFQYILLNPENPPAIRTLEIKSSRIPDVYPRWDVSHSRLALLVSVSWFQYLLLLALTNMLAPLLWWLCFCNLFHGQLSYGDMLSYHFSLKSSIVFFLCLLWHQFSCSLFRFFRVAVVCPIYFIGHYLHGIE